MAHSSTLHAALDRVDTHRTIVEPVTKASVALSTTTVVMTDGARYRIPKITQDPSAGWVAENDEIPLSEAAGIEIVVEPRKVAALTFISNELASDSSPEAHSVIGRGIARDIATKLDRAFFGAYIADDEDDDYDPIVPRALEAIPDLDLSKITANPATGIDPFIDALAGVEAAGSTVGAWVTTPTVASALAKLKTGSGSNLPLFGTGAVNGIERSILGVPLLVSPYVVAGTAWGIPKERIFSVLRQNVDLTLDKSAGFSRDQLAIRATMRVAWGFAETAAIAKIKA